MKKQLKDIARNGYVMIFSLLVIAALMTIVTYVGYRGSIHSPFMKMALSREKAKLMVLGGIEITKAQLAKVSVEKDKKSEQEAQTAPSQEEESRVFLQRILPTLNQ